jgi:phage terminase small subunit
VDKTVEKVSSRPLTTKQRLFVENYLINPNATEAARQAGYKGNDVTLGAVGAENLKKPQIAAFIQQRVEDVIITADEVLGDLKKIKDGKGERTSDKLKALELLGKYLKLFTDKIEHGGEVGLRLVDESE